MSINDDVLDQTIRHQVYLQRYNAQVLSRMRALLSRVDREIVSELADVTPGEGASLERKLANIRALNDQLGEDLKAFQRGEAGTLSEYEADYTLRTNERLTGFTFEAVSADYVRSATYAKFYENVHLRWALPNQHVDEFTRRRNRLVIDAIRRGAVTGDSVSQIMRTVRGTARAGYKDGLLDVSARTAETLVRTSLNHIANAAREEVYARNEHLLKGVQWVSVLDRRTSPICRSLDGKMFPVNSGPRPPAHPNCRSSTVSVFKGVANPEHPTYAEWLAKQSAETQKEILGPSRYKLYKDGGLTVDRFVDYSGKQYTLDQLRALDSAAFAKANLD